MVRIVQHFFFFNKDELLVKHCAAVVASGRVGGAAAASHASTPPTKAHRLHGCFQFFSISTSFLVLFSVYLKVSDKFLTQGGS